MALKEIFRQPCRRRYYSALLSKATFFSWGFIAVAVIISLILAYCTQGFFIIENTIMEDPVVTLLKSQIVTIVNTNKGIILYSVNNDPTYIYRSVQRLPIVTYKIVDSNMDSLIDSHIIEMEFPLNGDENALNVQAFIPFKYRLRRLSVVELNDYVYMETSGSSTTKSVSMIGTLEFNQQVSLNYKNYQLLDLPTVNPVNADEILSAYTNRTVYLSLSNTLNTWIGGRAGTAPLKVSITIYTKKAELRYKPGFWYSTKWAWIQFASIGIFALLLQQRIKEFLFSHDLLATVAVKSDLHILCDVEVNPSHRAAKKFI